MQPDATEFAFTGRRLRAVGLVAQDIRSDAAIAADLGINKVTLERWKQHPDFRARVEAERAAIAEAVRAEGIANKQNRIDAMNDRWGRMLALIEARAIAYAAGPGGHTGLVVGQLKTVRHVDTTDDDGERVWTQETWEYTFDAALMKEFREIEKEAAVELGQIVAKSEVSGPGGGAIPITGIAIPLPAPPTEDATE